MGTGAITGNSLQFPLVPHSRSMPTKKVQHHWTTMPTPTTFNILYKLVSLYVTLNYHVTLMVSTRKKHVSTASEYRRGENVRMFLDGHFL
jgi:hypothetical protein